MTRAVRAVYENGLFRPVEPVPDLAEGSRVDLYIQESTGAAGNSSAALTPDELHQLIRSKNPNPDVPDELWDEVRRSTELALQNVRDPERMRKAAERMDRMREELRQRVGMVDLALPLMRESRDDE